MQNFRHGDSDAPMLFLPSGNVGAKEKKDYESGMIKQKEVLQCQKVKKSLDLVRKLDLRTNVQ